MSAQLTDSLASNRTQEVSLNPALVPLMGAAVLYALSWIVGCSSTSTAVQKSSTSKASGSRAAVRLASDNDINDKQPVVLSGRRLTMEKMAQRAATSLQFSNEEYGVAFDAPKGYLLKEGELPEMDRGLGYLGAIPMHFVEPGGVRLATIEPPTGTHIGTNFVNEFFTISALYGSSSNSCLAFDIEPEFRVATVARTIDGIEFNGVKEGAVASMHQYTGIYLHGYANETCYEIAYGVATIGDDAARNIKHVDPEKLLSRLDKILDSIRISPPEFERFTSSN